VRQWLAGDGAECLTVGRTGASTSPVRDGSRYSRARPPAAASPSAPRDAASVSAIAVHGGDILVADASARIIRRFDATGRQRNLIGDQGKTKTFMLPTAGWMWTSTSRGCARHRQRRHQVTSWALDGTPIGRFGKFGMQDPADFVGCCNPINVATTRTQGRHIREDGGPVKVFEPTAACSP